MSQTIETNEKVWKIGVLSLTLDLDDADVMERYENAFDQMAQEEKTIPKDGRTSARLRAYCELYRRLFDRIFGEGTSAQLFDSYNVQRHEDAYMQFLDFVRSQKEQTTKARAQRMQRYLPNRAQKRAAKKSAKKTT